MPPTSSTGQKNPPPLPITWQSLNTKNIRHFQTLQATIFPIKYNQLFYVEALKAPKGFVKLAFYKELLVGAVCCRKEKYTPSNPRTQILGQPSSSGEESASSNFGSSLYIMTLGVLAPYRERGIGRRLITHVLDLVRTSPACEDVVDVYLHVQEGNDEALRFYEKYGFRVAEKLMGYYKRIEPANCYVVRKAINKT